MQRNNASRVRQENLAFRREFELPAVSFKEPSPDLLLNLPDLNAHGGLREVYYTCGAREAAGVCDNDKCAQRGDVEKHEILVAKSGRP